ncbi:MAG: SpoIIE family protein phosphatase [Acidobacteriia bacterium]|nr:SpoIIE family protein phosphatase [Terriglobia bacterium]
MAPSATATSIRPLPEVVFVQGGEQRTIKLDRTPFTVGRKTDKDLVIADPRISRDHAEIQLHGEDFILVDVGSRHGTYVNGAKVERQKLAPNDRVEFGARGGPYLVFSPTAATTSTAREFLSQISGISMPSGTATSDLEKLTLFLDAARKLNTTGVLEEILVTLIEATLRLTGAERGYVFLREPDGKLALAVGRNSKGEPLLDDTTVSRSIIEEAAASASAYHVTDTTKTAEIATRKSVIAYDLRTVICIPFRKHSVQGKAGGKPAPTAGVTGVLYMDSRYASRDLSIVSKDILNAIATEAAALVENARLVQAEEAARRYQQELTIAASIQQRLMAVTIPELPFAQIQATNVACKDIGGDFYDVVPTDNGVAVVITDVCGKGVSAALLASILQGMIYTNLTAAVPLERLAQTTNDFLVQKALGEKYATVFIAHISRDGELVFVNCGHVQPVLVSNGKVERMKESNVPLGLLPGATYQCGRRKLVPGDRLVLFTDGVTEAENGQGEFFGDERLEAAAAQPNPFEAIFTDVRSFCAGVPFSDDCTVFELTYRG